MQPGLSSSVLFNSGGLRCIVSLLCNYYLCQRCCFPLDESRFFELCLIKAAYAIGNIQFRPSTHIQDTETNVYFLNVGSKERTCERGTCNGISDSTALTFELFCTGKQLIIFLKS